MNTNTNTNAIENIDNRIEIMRTVKTMILKLDDCVSSLDWDIEYHKRNIDDALLDDYHKKEYETLLNEQNRRREIRNKFAALMMIDYNI